MKQINAIGYLLCGSWGAACDWNGKGCPVAGVACMFGGINNGCRWRTAWVVDQADFRGVYAGWVYYSYVLQCQNDDNACFVQFWSNDGFSFFVDFVQHSWDLLQVEQYKVYYATDLVWHNWWIIIFVPSMLCTWG